MAPDPGEHGTSEDEKDESQEPIGTREELPNQKGHSTDGENDKEKTRSQGEEKHRNADEHWDPRLGR